jgi:hypothetical protein
MASRKALIIGAPDEKIPGVNVDVKQLKDYLKSPIGGLWYESEITTLISPSASSIRVQLALLGLSDYSLVFFGGHGFHSIERNRTILHINSNETLDSLELRAGAKKHSLILDCCRKAESERRLLKSATEAMVFDHARGQSVDPAQCRQFYDHAISECETGIVVMNACSVNETAGESNTEGGYYTSSLIDAGKEWAKKKLSSIDLSRNYSTSSTQDCHNAALVQVRLLSGGRQTPSFESPRAEKKFPFAVVA